MANSNLTSRTITGVALFLGGIFLICIPFILGFGTSWWVAWLYGFPVLIIGVFILFNKKEDNIERRKDKK